MSMEATAERIMRSVRLQTILPRIDEYIRLNFEEEPLKRLCTVEEQECYSDRIVEISSFDIGEEYDSSFEEDTQTEIRTISTEHISAKRKKRSLSDVLDEAEETFSQSLLRMITQKDLKDSDVYNRANISRQLFSKIRKDIDYQPTKKTVFALIIAMELNIDEAKDLLEKAGFSFSPSKKEDLVVQYFIEEENYDIFLLNEVLEHFKLPTLF